MHLLVLTLFKIVPISVIAVDLSSQNNFIHESSNPSAQLSNAISFKPLNAVEFRLS